MSLGRHDNSRKVGGVEQNRWGEDVGSSQFQVNEGEGLRGSSGAWGGKRDHWYELNGNGY